MKRIVALMCILLTGTAAFSQKKPKKPQKPNLNKVLIYWREGKLDEAKTMIDSATVYEKTKNDGKTWYYRGLVYASLDTTSNEAFRALAEDPIAIAVESFQKADSLAKKGTDYYIMDGMNFTTKTSQIQMLFAHYLNRGAERYQAEDFANAVKYFEKAQVLMPNDTTGYLYAGVAAYLNEDYDKAITNFRGFIEKGGTSPDGYYKLLDIYLIRKQDREKALEIAREARQKYPDDFELAKSELGLLIDLKRVDEAKAGLKSAIEKEPDNKVFHYYLGYIYFNEKQLEDARKCFENALKIDPEYFESQYFLAQSYFEEAQIVQAQMKKLGVTAADRKKQKELDQLLVEKLKIALPYWERCEQLKPNEIEVLDRLRTIYYFLGNDAREKQVAAKLKVLSSDDNN